MHLQTQTRSLAHDRHQRPVCGLHGRPCLVGTGERKTFSNQQGVGSGRRAPEQRWGARSGRRTLSPTVGQESRARGCPAGWCLQGDPVRGKLRMTFRITLGPQHQQVTWDSGPQRSEDRSPEGLPLPTEHAHKDSRGRTCVWESSAERVPRLPPPQPRVTLHKPSRDELRQGIALYQTPPPPARTRDSRPCLCAEVRARPGPRRDPRGCRGPRSRERREGLETRRVPDLRLETTGPIWAGNYSLNG